MSGMWNHLTKGAWEMIVILLGALLLSACTIPQPLGVSRESASVQAAAVAAPPPIYRIQPGDLVDVKFYYNDRLSDRIRVRPDGKVSLQLVGDVQAAGLTPEEFRKTLLDLYAPHQRILEIAVVMREFAGQKIFVGGEVNSPGAIETFGNLTAFRAILAAGGLKGTAAIRNVVVLRDVPGKQPLFMTVDLEAGAGSTGEGRDVVLQPFDVVFVPKSSISQLGQFVDQYIKQVIPISFTVGFSWVRGLQTIP
jgi:protein involved in polysaccharide export with SLBB domain